MMLGVRVRVCLWLGLGLGRCSMLRLGYNKG